MNKILSFTDLAAWQYGHKLKLEIYRFTKLFPKEERYGQIQQIRDAANSITNNLAEGFGRRFENEKIQFYSYALGSLREVQNQLMTAQGVGYIDKIQFEEAFALSHLTAKTTAALIASIQRRKTPNAKCHMPIYAQPSKTILENGSTQPKNYKICLDHSALFR